MAEQPQTPTPAPVPEDRGLIELPDFGALFRRFGAWCSANPLGVVFLLLYLGVLGYYYFGIKAFLNRSMTPAEWITINWSPTNDQEHGYVVLPITILLLLMRWRDFEKAEIKPSNTGLWFIGAGVLCMVAAMRCIEGRYSILALVFLSYGSVLFLFGKQAARIAAFPCAFMLFMIPMSGLVQGTAGLVSKTANVIQAVCSLFGLPIRSEGAMIISLDNKFEPLEVAGGCSGIRSLMAMMLLSALYAYFVMRTPWRGFLLFACSLLFALVGNFARVFSVVLVARYIGSGAAHSYHDWSGFVFFPVAVLAMAATGTLINRDWKSILSKAIAARVPASALPAADAVSAPVTTQPALSQGAGGESSTAQESSSAPQPKQQPGYDY